jgi:hypothetical protein
MTSGLSSDRSYRNTGNEESLLEQKMVEGLTAIKQVQVVAH